ncbi:FHA domain-containing protein [Inquilinus sp. NPDC058860]|uniref:SctD/MshK family protein n=1 Tax=Inquilinus sp. NPDC058860 TaxID=3346652 RepID=UPI00367D41AC
MLSKFKALISDSPLQGPIQRLFPQSPSVTLFVLAGPNAGTVQKLAPAAYRVGSGLESDIVLADEALAPVHALIDIDRHRVRIEPLAGTMTVPGRAGLLEPGGAVTLPLPAELTLGSSRIVLRSPVEATVGGSRLRAVTVTAALLVILGGLSGIALSSGGSGGSEGQAGDQAAAPEAGKPAVQTAALAPVVPRQQTPQEALQARIDAAGLGGIALDAKGSRIVASGRLSPAEMAQWRETQAWFDRTFASSALLASEVTTGAGSGAPELVIQAVWTGDNPYLITHTGSKYFEGADLGGGWSVDTIRADAVTLRSRAGQSFVMVLTDPAKP